MTFGVAFRSGRRIRSLLTYSGRMVFTQSDKLADVCYDVRGPILDEAMRLEAAGQRILKLNIGNPAPFGFCATYIQN